MTHHSFTPKTIACNEPNNLLEGLAFYSAQEYCNFVLFEPTYLPENSKIITKSMQTETDTTRASHYCIIRGQGDLEFSIKQFNFSDIETIPAYDHPNLWKCESTVANREKFANEFFVHSYIFGGDNSAISDNIIWIGFNYKTIPQKALSTQIMRTSIEITIKNGQLNNEELLKICRGLKISHEQIADGINKTAFVELSRRYRCKGNEGNIPISYWKYKRSTNFKIEMYSFNQIPSHLFGRKTCPFAIGNYHLNSATHFLDQQTNETQEVEYLFEHNILIGSYIRILMSPIDTGSIIIPPEIDNQNCQHREFECNKTTVYHTYLKDEYGMHGAAWKNELGNIMVFAKPAAWTNIRWFEKLIDKIMKLTS
jgi:hypothetical protein